jgi:hypothetical protein
MDAAFMSFQPHESGIHVVWSGAGEASVTEVRFRCAARPTARPGRRRGPADSAARLTARPNRRLPGINGIG